MKTLASNRGWGGPVSGFAATRFRKTARLPVALAAALAASLLTGAQAAYAGGGALSFDETPVTDAVAQIDRALDADIVIKPGINIKRAVTFDVTDLDGTGARMQAIASLADALHADFQKVFVIRRHSDFTDASAPAIDAVDAPVYIKDGTSAEDAIRTVAHVDGALVQFYSPVSGTVTLTDDQTTDSDAAADLARQTDTVWTAEYVITPHISGGGDMTARVIGHTADGQPITEYPDITFRVARTPVPDQPAPVPAGAAGAGQGGSAAAGQTAAGATGQNPQGAQAAGNPQAANANGTAGAPNGAQNASSGTDAQGANGDQGSNGYPNAGPYGNTPYGYGSNQTLVFGGSQPNGFGGSSGLSNLGPGLYGLGYGSSGYGYSPNGYGSTSTSSGYSYGGNNNGLYVVPNNPVMYQSGPTVF